MKDDMYPLFCFSVSSRVTPKKSQFLKCRLLGKKKKKKLFSLGNCLFCVGSSFFWEALFGLVFFF